MTRRVLFARIVTALVAVPLAGVIKPPSRVFAAGGPVTAGGIYIVGESGPEIFVPWTDGVVMPNVSTDPRARPAIACLRAKLTLDSLERQLNNLSARDVARLQMIALKLGQETAFSAEEAAKGVQELIDAGNMPWADEGD